MRDSIDPTRQAIRGWCGRLAKLAAESPPNAATGGQHQLSSPINPFPARLSAIVAQLRQRVRTQEHVAAIMANEFLAGV
jgi:hypothetical protein